MQVNAKRYFMGRLEAGTDLLDEITSFCFHENISLGIINIIGAVRSAKLGYYDQKMQKYEVCVDISGKTLEIASAMGNISLKDDKPFVHLHIIFADHNGNCFGGHLMQGAEVFAAEYFIQEFSGGNLERSFDKTTGLMLWP